MIPDPNPVSHPTPPFSRRSTYRVLLFETLITGVPMAEEGFERKLTAILSADVKGYSRLMQDDEEAMLSEAFYVKDNSRLGCQIPITDELHGLEVELAPDY